MLTLRKRFVRSSFNSVNSRLPPLSSSLSVIRSSLVDCSSSLAVSSSSLVLWSSSLLDWISSLAERSSSLIDSCSSMRVWRCSLVAASSCSSWETRAFFGFCPDFFETGDGASSIGMRLSSKSKTNQCSRVTGPGIGTTSKLRKLTSPLPWASTPSLRAACPRFFASTSSARSGISRLVRIIRKRSRLASPGSGSRKGATLPRNCTILIPLSTTMAGGQYLAISRRSVSLRRSGCIKAVCPVKSAKSCALFGSGSSPSIRVREGLWTGRLENSLVFWSTGSKRSRKLPTVSAPPSNRNPPGFKA